MMALSAAVTRDPVQLWDPRVVELVLVGLVLPEDVEEYDDGPEAGVFGCCGEVEFEEAIATRRSKKFKVYIEHKIKLGY
jgi:hypothetical protein